ncbi:ABC transporter ATP-binding protein [Chamaesiphon minutus]|uniref:ABC-type antimicrobial peptide transport system, ATPase component n=1 Tax=Chamaesiphon minutus (strain ATCC 27169 / PCC 6605) TaxID=1173020 RepID=K9UB46_CHAP6|nr:ABC transporter ATP-binding protein [Chamaesiphon minutus]AFY91444.1 ABC-type antimicrobial peptide transport system, ATPase component [Chamaesiphon minutus PCC 6605]
MNDDNRQIIIRLENIYKTYGIEDTLVKALDDVTLTIAEGEYCAIMGPSGSGKSSAMNVIGCLDQPTSGHYYLDKLDVSTVPDAELAKIRNRKLGFIFQQFHLLPQLNALENVMLPMIYGGLNSSERKERAVVALEKVGLSNRMANRPNQLSGGQQQRVAIARAIVGEPRVLLADEPTGALDSRTTQEVMDIFTQLNETGITIVMVTHEPDVAKQTKRIVWFKDGRVIHSHLTPSEIYQVAMAG